MVFKKANFVSSSSHYTQITSDKKIELAFIGRSNVGKSSLINALTNRKNLAKVSSTPGKTQLINHFIIEDIFYLVDLPGYGYAKVSKAERRKWDAMIYEYLVKSEELVYLFILLDSRIPPQKIDLEFINWAGEKSIPIALVFTKIDKLSRSKAQSFIAEYKKVLENTWEEMPIMFCSSIISKEGQEDLCAFMRKIVRDWH